MGIVSANTTRTRPSSRVVRPSATVRQRRQIDGHDQRHAEDRLQVGLIPRRSAACRVSAASKWVVAMTSVPWQNTTTRLYPHFVCQPANG